MKNLKNTTKILSILIISLSLFSCSGVDRKKLVKGPIFKEFEQSSFDRKEKGVVILKVTAKNDKFKIEENAPTSNKIMGSIVNFSKNTFVPKISKYEMYWLKEDTVLNDIYQSEWFLIEKGATGNGFINSLGVNSSVDQGEYLVYSLDEGTYNLFNLEVYNSYFALAGNNGWVFAGEYHNKLVDFEVKNGEVLYLGDLDIFYQNDNIDKSQHAANLRIKIEDKFDEAKNFLKKQYPALANKMKKRFVNGKIVIQ